ncbi:MAG: hypothetical protein LAO08_00425 [Acidobacteriia bacterium]|nr:hypothetical protein [Terriglobia bacterium]
MSFNGLYLRFIRFLGPKKEPAAFTFTPGLNLLWGASDTGKTFLVQAIDFMLGAGDELKDIPERNGYDRVLLGITTASKKDYTLQRSLDGGNFLRFDGLVMETPTDLKAATKLNARHGSGNAKNLSRWLLQEIGLDNKSILWSKESGEVRALGFRALAHLCVITSRDIIKPSSPIEAGQYLEKTREYGVFKLLLTGVDDSAVVSETEAPSSAIVKPALRPELLEQMLASYEDELANLTDDPEDLDNKETEIDEQLELLQATLRNMEGRLADSTRERRNAFEQYSNLASRSGEIGELQARFKLLDEQYDTDLKRLQAIEESGQFFVLIPVTTCPLCGATSENQKHDSVCDGNVAAVTQAASAEITKIALLRRELQETVATLSKENVSISLQRETLEGQLRSLQGKIDAALSPEFAEARQVHSELIERRSSIRSALAVYRRVVDIRQKLRQTGTAAPDAEPEEEAPVAQYLPKSVLGDFSNNVEAILQAWHFPNATDVYFDERTRDLVIGGKPRGSRGSGLCAITHSAFTIALLDYCRKLQLPHPGFVILDSPLLAYKEPQGEDENIAGTDLKPRFYEHLINFIGQQQLFIVENTEPPADILAKVHHEEFTHNPNIGRFGLFPRITNA